MCVVADTNNKVGRTKIDSRGRVSLFVGYSTQHAGDVYRLLNLKRNRVNHSRDVTLIGKTWAEFYKIKMVDRASGYVDRDEDFQLGEEEQDIDEDYSEPIQVGQPQAEQPREPSVEVEEDEPVASRRRSQTEPVARLALGSDPEVSAFADVKEEKTLIEWLHEIAFVTSTMSDPDEPKSFQEAWFDPDLIARENGKMQFAWSSRRCWTWVFGDM